MNLLSQYLERADDIIGERTREQELYDIEVVNWLKKCGKIRKAINKANKKYPNEAIKYDDSNIHDVASHYDYLMRHMDILKKLGKEVTGARLES